MDNQFYISNLVSKTKSLSIENNVTRNVVPNIQSPNSHIVEEPFTIEHSHACEDDQTVFSTNKSLDEMNTFLDIFMKKIFELQLTQVATNTIFSIFRDFVEKMYRLNCESIQRHSTDDIVNVLDGTRKFVVDKIHEFDSKKKCQNKIKSSEDYVKPREVCIGTKIEMKKDKITNLRLPTQTQPTFEYIPILETLKKIFSVETTKNTYFNYNSNRKHTCIPSKYVDFCCGQMHKKNSLFAEFPESLQLQLFIDGFAVCDALKSKALKHIQIAIYLAIRNMPPELGYNLDNIFLVALCNSAHLKSDEVDYNNLWKAIIDDIRSLEDIGIYLNDGRILRGIFKC